MSLNKSILEIYTVFESNKKLISEVSDVYANIDFRDGVVGSSKPSTDTINTSLLSDINTAARNAGVNVSVTTAVSGHESLPSRHPSGNAVDIAIINNKAVSLANRADTDKFVDELVKMGYVKNKEVGSSKAVLTFGFPRHDNHVHVSNSSGTSNLSTGESGNETFSSAAGSTTTSSSGTTSGGGQGFLQNMFSQIAPQFGFNESVLEQTEFGKKSKSSGTKIIIPSNENQVVKAPVDGVIDNSKLIQSCSKKVILKISKGYHLVYCGMDTVLVLDGQKISSGQKLGTVKDDVTVFLYDESFNPISYTTMKQKSGSELEKKFKKGEKPDVSITSALAQLPFKVFQDKYDPKTGERIEKRWGFATDKEPVDPWIVNALSKPFQKIGKFLGTNKSVQESHNTESGKIHEEIKRIKSLLK